MSGLSLPCNSTLYSQNSLVEKAIRNTTASTTVSQNLFEENIVYEIISNLRNFLEFLK